MCQLPVVCLQYCQLLVTLCCHLLCMLELLAMFCHQLLQLVQLLLGLLLALEFAVQLLLQVRQHPLQLLQLSLCRSKVLSGLLLLLLHLLCCLLKSLCRCTFRFPESFLSSRPSLLCLLLCCLQLTCQTTLLVLGG